MINHALGKNSYENEYGISINPMNIIFLWIIEANSSFWYLCHIQKIQLPSTKKKAAEYLKQPRVIGLR